MTEESWENDYIEPELLSTSTRVHFDIFLWVKARSGSQGPSNILARKPKIETA